MLANVFVCTVALWPPSSSPPPTISAVRIATLLQPSRHYRRQGERSRLSVSDILPPLPTARLYSPSKRTRNPWLIPLRTDRELERENYVTIFSHMRLRFPFFYIILSLYCFIHNRVDTSDSFEL